MSLSTPHLCFLSPFEAERKYRDRSRGWELKTRSTPCSFTVTRSCVGAEFIFKLAGLRLRRLIYRFHCGKAKDLTHFEQPFYFFSNSVPANRFSRLFSGTSRLGFKI